MDDVHVFPVFLTGSLLIIVVLLLVSYVRLPGTKTALPWLDVIWVGLDPGGVAGPAHLCFDGRSVLLLVLVEL